MRQKRAQQEPITKVRNFTFILFLFFKKCFSPQDSGNGYCYDLIEGVNIGREGHMCRTTGSSSGSYTDVTFKEHLCIPVSKGVHFIF